MTSKISLLPACVSALVLLNGCGLFEQRPAEAPVSPQTEAPALSGRKARLAESKAPSPTRHVGDFFVHRFSGSFAPEPLILTEEVVAREKGVWVVDFSLAEGDLVERVRVRFDDATGQAVSAARLEGTSEVPATLAEYDALLARTVYAADVNDGLVEEARATCLVGADELDCETKTYKVWVGEAEAKLSVVHSARFADRDVAGEITTQDGKLIYRAELIEATQNVPGSGVALSP